MSNSVMNELTCIFPNVEQYNAFKEKANTQELFNIFIPMPEILVDTPSPSVDVDKLISNFNKETNSTVIGLIEIIESNNKWYSDLAKDALKNQQAFIFTGYYNWFSWSRDNWGSTDCSDIKTKALPDFFSVVFDFDSPWEAPEAFVRGLSKLYPDATFEMVSGSNETDFHREVTCINGELEVTCSYDNFREAVKDGKWGGIEEWTPELFEENPWK